MGSAERGVSRRDTDGATVKGGTMQAASRIGYNSTTSYGGGRWERGGAMWTAFTEGPAVRRHYGGFFARTSFTCSQHALLLFLPSYILQSVYLTAYHRMKITQKETTYAGPIDPSEIKRAVEHLMPRHELRVTRARLNTETSAKITEGYETRRSMMRHEIRPKNAYAYTTSRA